MRKSWLGVAAVLTLIAGGKALADLSYTQGVGTTIFDFVCFTTKHCSAHVSIDSSGTEKFTGGNPGSVSLVSSTVGAVAGTSATGALGSMVNCSSTTNPTGATTGNQGYANCAPTGEWRSAIDAVASGGASTTGNIAANNTTAVVVKASAGTLYGVQVYGIGSAPAYLKIYNATSATCGSGTPVKRLMIPAASTAANGAGSNITFYPGVAFPSGITYCVTTGIADADTTAPAASTFLVNLDWQ